MLHGRRRRLVESEAHQKYGFIFFSFCGDRGADNFDLRRGINKPQVRQDEDGNREEDEEVRTFLLVER